MYKDIQEMPTEGQFVVIWKNRYNNSPGATVLRWHKGELQELTREINLEEGGFEENWKTGQFFLDDMNNLHDKVFIIVENKDES